MRALGVDIDFNLILNPEAFPKMRQAGVSFAYVRLGQGIVLDLEFADFWKRSKDVGLLRGAYFVLSPAGDPANTSSWYNQQMEWVKRNAPTDAELPLSIDIELGQGNLTDDVHRFVGGLKDVYQKILIYTSLLGWWNDHIKPMPWAGSYDYWMAEYPAPNKNTDPKVRLGDWVELKDRLPKSDYWPASPISANHGPRTKIWQWSGDFYMPPGFGDSQLHGALADIDLFDGDLNDLRHWAGLPPAAEDDPGFRLASSEGVMTEPEPLVTQRPAEVAVVNVSGQTANAQADQNFRTGKVTAPDGLIIRDGPGTSFTRIASKNFGETLHIGAEKEGWGSLADAPGWVNLDFVAFD